MSELTAEQRVSSDSKSSLNLHSTRQEYELDKNIPFLPATCEDPLPMFAKWLQEALDAYSGGGHSNQDSFMEVNAMSLATATPDGIPSVRTVLLKEFSPQRGFTFFTNYNSRKGKELTANPRAAISFYWGKLHRTVRAEGVVKRVPEKESDEYFASRPLGSQCAAKASNQSQYIDSFEEFDQRYLEISKQYSAQEKNPGSASNSVPRPPNWGGLYIVPLVIEFWQGMSNRCHRRIVFERSTVESDTWTRRLLAP